MEVFEKTYKKKGAEPDEVVWCDERFKEKTAQYSVLQKEIMDQLLTEKELGTELTEKEISDAQSQAYLRAPGCKKGRVYGLGSASSMFYSKDSLSSRSTSFIDNSRVVALKEFNATLATKVEALAQVMERLTHRLNQCDNNPLDQPPHHPRDPPSPPGTREQTSVF